MPANERWYVGYQFEVSLTKLSRKSDTTAAIRYALTLWPALTRYCDDGRLEIDNDAAERPRIFVVASDIVQEEFFELTFGRMDAWESACSLMMLKEHSTIVTQEA